MRDGSPCLKCKRPTPTQAQWEYDGPLHGNGNGCQCDECCSICWSDPLDCLRASRGEPVPESVYTKAQLDAAVQAEREACAIIAEDHTGDQECNGEDCWELIRDAIRARGSK